MNSKRDAEYMKGRWKKNQKKTQGWNEILKEMKKKGMYKIGERLPIRKEINK